MGFFWGKNTETEGHGKYVLELAAVFVAAVLVESLSHSRLVGSSGMGRVAVGLLQTLMYGARMALAYVVMLAVMSFNVGVFLVAVAGYSAGYLIFGSGVFDKPEAKAAYQKPTDLPPLNC
ncbi:hypothetical protein NMG60_11034131 [Bertholletia excelsa]